MTEQSKIERAKNFLKMLRNNPKLTERTKQKAYKAFIRRQREEFDE